MSSADASGGATGKAGKIPKATSNLSHIAHDSELLSYTMYTQVFVISPVVIL